MRTKNINIVFTDSYEIAIKYCKVRHPTTLDVRDHNDDDSFFGLDEEDVERIQEILDESDDEGDADYVELLSDDENEFPMPMKPTRKDLN